MKTFIAIALFAFTCSGCVVSTTSDITGVEYKYNTDTKKLSTDSVVMDAVIENVKSKIEKEKSE